MAHARRYYTRKKGTTRHTNTTHFTRTIYDKCVKRLTKGKAPGPDNIPTNIIKILPPQCHDLMYLFFHHCYKQREIPTQWKQSKTILLHKKKTPPNWPTTSQSPSQIQSINSILTPLQFSSPVMANNTDCYTLAKKAFAHKEISPNKSR